MGGGPSCPRAAWRGVLLACDPVAYSRFRLLRRRLNRIRATPSRGKRRDQLRPKHDDGSTAFRAFAMAIKASRYDLALQRLWSLLTASQRDKSSQISRFAS